MLAQTGSPDFFAGLRFIMRPEFSRYLILFAGLLVLLVVAAVIAAVVRRSRQAVSQRQSIMAFSNLDQLKGKGLLTPEETRQIRLAMARRIMEADNHEPASVETLEVEAVRADLEESVRKKISEGPEEGDQGAQEGKRGEKGD